MKPIYFKILFMLLLGIATVQSRAGITLLSPNGGEVFHNQVIVRWSANGATNSINIYLSTDDGSTYTPELLGYSITPNDTGSITLNSLNSSRRSNRCFIRIEDASAPASFDASNDSFAVQVNYAPQAYDSLVTPMNVPIAYAPDVYDNDTDDKHVITTSSNPPNGTVIALSDSTFTYTPNSGYVGYDSFSVRICDDGTPSLCGNGFVRIYVGCDQLEVNPGANATICSTSGYLLGGNPTASGGTAPYSYQWSAYTILDNAYSANPVITSNYSGTRVVLLRVTDANGCLADTIVRITGGSSGNLIIQNGIINTGCLGNTGSIDIGVSGGGTYTYSWSNGTTTEDVSGLQAGTYIVSVSDGSTCISTKSFIVGQDTAAFVINQDNLQNAGCLGNDGSIRVIVSGPGAPFTYAWSNVATTNEVTGLSSGTYTVTVTNSSGCSLIRSFGIGSSSASFSLQDTIFPANCGSNNGEIDLIVTGPGAPFTYLWSNGSTGSGINSLSAGLYFVTVLDNAGCSLRDSFDVTSSPVFSIVTDFKNDESCAGNDGVIDVSVFGAGAPFTYAWSIGATTDDIAGLDSGQYSLIVTNSFGCTATEYYHIAPSSTVLHITRDSIVKYTCGVPAGGFLAVSASGGTAPYTYLWNNGVSPDNEISGLPGGVYTVYAVDAMGCSASYSDTIIEVQSLSLSAIVTNIGCNSLGAIDLSVGGTAGPYTYEWSNVYTTEDLVAISLAGNYSVTVTNGSGCSAVQTYPIANVSSSLHVSIKGDSVLCANQQTILYAYVTGDTTSYAIDWQYPGMPANDTSANILVKANPGNSIAYILTVTDITGCSKSDTMVVRSTTDSITVVIDSIQAQGCPNPLGSIFISANSAALPLTYEWVNAPLPTFTEDLLSVQANTYYLNVKNASGCVHQDMITVPRGIESYIDNGDTTFCNIDTVRLRTFTSQGIAPYTYKWASSNPAYNSTDEVLKAYGGETGFVVVEVTDSKGCKAFDSAYIFIDTCVWPGDANYDGVVSADDVLNIGVAYGDTGYWRGTNINWFGFRSRDWERHFADGLDHEHADCNGDAIINHDDTIAVTVNYSKTHARGGWVNGDRMVDPVLTTTFSADTTYAGQGLTAQVQLGTSTLPATDVFGIAFRMNFPPGKVDTFLGLDFTGNWLTAGNANAIYFRKLNMSQGFVDICVVRTDGTNRTGFGLLANASFVMKDDITGKNDNRTFSTFEITYSNVKMISANEDVLSVFAEDKETMLAQFPNGIGQVDEIKATVYPNPVHQTMLLVADGMLQQVEVVNGLGSNLNVPVELKGNTANVDASGLTAGVYYLHLTTANGKAVKRIVKY